eukprot:scaffold5072_cov19-Tisochrysis_lutea.AAC.1
MDAYALRHADEACMDAFALRHADKACMDAFAFRHADEAFLDVYALRDTHVHCLCLNNCVPACTAPLSGCTHFSQKCLHKGTSGAALLPYCMIISFG